MVGRLAKRYARALFSLTRDVAEQTGEELQRAAAALEDPRLRLVLLSPAIELVARHKVAREVVRALSVSPMVANLVLLLSDRDRLAFLSDVARVYEEMIDETLGRARVTIRSASALTPAERTEVTELARRLTGRREILATTEVDPDLLGGVVLDVAGTVYDGSIRAQLARLSKQMAAGRA